MNVYSAPIKIRQTSTTAAAEPVWAMRLNTTSTRIATIRKIYISVSFDGTAAATTSSYSIERYDSMTFTGGTAITVASADSGNITSDMTDVRFLDTGLTDTDVANIIEFGNIGCPRGATSQAVPFVFMKPMILRRGEGLQITLDEAAVIGDALRGYVEWSEINTGGQVQ